MAMGGGAPDGGIHWRSRSAGGGPPGNKPATAGSTVKKKKKKLRWAHVTSTEVNSALAGLLENTIVVLPESCVQASGIQPNINDKNKPKKLVSKFSFIQETQPIEGLATTSYLMYVTKIFKIVSAWLVSTVAGAAEILE
eukprot:scaffold647876_cov36-Prasinocladus_malaysianus.AAC.1